MANDRVENIKIKRECILVLFHFCLEDGEQYDFGSVLLVLCAVK